MGCYSPLQGLRADMLEDPDVPPGHEVWEDAGFLLGLDLGKRQDYAAACLLQRYVRDAYLCDGAELNPVSFEIEVRCEH